MITKEELKQLQAIAKANGWSIISEVGIIEGLTVYELKRPNAHGKIGYPHLYTFIGNTVKELGLEQVRIIIKQSSFQSGGKRLQ